MNASAPASTFYVGWDVGGWNCDKNGKSRDAIVILDADLKMVGKPWRGNLRDTINEKADAGAFVNALFVLCDPDSMSAARRVIMGIDTPLGFPQAFADLFAHRQAIKQIDNSATNPYLFRRTERFLFEHGLSPLSAIKDMIGSQATKGMHTLAKFAPHNNSCGVWSDGQRLTAIEAYPSACKVSSEMDKLLKRCEKLPCDEKEGEPSKRDKQDALTCALVAYMHEQHKDLLAKPEDSASPGEGWIWVPKDALGSTAQPIEV